MQAFVERSTAFASADTRLAAQREAYLRMAAAFTPRMPAGLIQIDHAARPHCPALRSYLPALPRPAGGWPTVVYLHGGGWMLGNLDSHDFICRPLALALSAQVVAVDYRLAPEHPYPAALTDTQQAWSHVGAWPGVNARSMVVAGDSAGANLAASLCLALRAQGQAQPRGQVLVYPLLGTGGTPSYQQHACAPLLTAADAQACLAGYLGGHPAPGELAVPLLAPHLGGLAPAFTGVAQFDPLRDDGVRYAERLRADRVAAELCEVGGWLHGALRAWDSPETLALRGAMFAWLADRLA